MSDLGRNDRCPCGSGKKYKNCCLARNDNNIKSGRLCVSLFYPEYICIADNTGFQFELDNKQVLVAIINHLTPLEILDFDNSIVQKDKGSMPNQKVLTIENPVDNISDTQIALNVNSMIVKLLDHRSYLHRLFTPRFYTEIIIMYEAEEEEYANGSAFVFHEEVLNRFINSYRLITKDVEVKSPQELYNDSLVKKTCWLRYTKKELSCSLEDRMVLPKYINFDIRQMKYEKYGGSIPKRNPEREEKSGSYLATYLKGEQKITLVDELIIKAIEECKVNKNYKYALLNAFTAVEVVVSDFLTEFKIKNGVSNKKLEEYKSEIGISYMLNVEVPMVMKDLSNEGRIILGNVDKVRKKRNAVIHSGAQVSDKEAKEAINAVLKLLALIDSSKHEVLCFSVD